MGDIVEKFKLILHLHLSAVLQANRQTSEVKLSGIPSASEEPVKKRNVKSCWDLHVEGFEGMSKRWDAHCFVKGCKLQKSNCKPQDTQDSWSSQPKYRLNSTKKYTLFQLCGSLWTSCFFINRRTEKWNLFVKYLGQRATPQTFKGSARNGYL